MSCDQVGTVISCILFWSDTICFASLRLHSILPISGFRFLHSLSSSFILAILISVFILSSSLTFYLGFSLYTCLHFFLIYYFLTSFISSWLSFLICPYNSSLFLSFIPHFLSSTITTVQSAFVLCFQEPHVWTSPRKLKIPKFYSAICKFHP